MTVWFNSLDEVSVQNTEALFCDDEVKVGVHKGSSRDRYGGGGGGRG